MNFMIYTDTFHIVDDIPIKVSHMGEIPFSEGLAWVKVSCTYIPPAYWFIYIWKMLIPNKVSNWITRSAEKFDTACIYHTLLMNCADFWADYVLCCHNAIKPWFLTGELVIQGLTWLCSIMQLQFPAYVGETIILQSNACGYFRRMGHSAWWTYVQQVTTILPFLIVQVGDGKMGEIFPGAKKSQPVGSWVE